MSLPRRCLCSLTSLVGSAPCVQPVRFRRVSPACRCAVVCAYGRVCVSVCVHVSQRAVRRSQSRGLERAVVKAAAPSHLTGPRRACQRRRWCRRPRPWLPCLPLRRSPRPNPNPARLERVRGALFQPQRRLRTSSRSYSCMTLGTPVPTCHQRVQRCAARHSSARSTIYSSVVRVPARVHAPGREGGILVLYIDCEHKLDPDDSS